MSVSKWEVLCAVSQHFEINLDYSSLLSELQTEGLIVPVTTWEPTEQGLKVLEAKPWLEVKRDAR